MLPPLLPVPPLSLDDDAVFVEAEDDEIDVDVDDDAVVVCCKYRKYETNCCVAFAVTAGDKPSTSFDAANHN